MTHQLDKILDGTNFSSANKGLKAYYSWLTDKHTESFVSFEEVVQACIKSEDIPNEDIYAFVTATFNGLRNGRSYNFVPSGYVKDSYSFLLEHPEEVYAHVRPETIQAYREAIARINSHTFFS